MKYDLFPVPFPSGKGCLPAKVNTLRELQSPKGMLSASGEELSAMTSSPSTASGMPSVLDKAFKGEL